MSQFNIASFGGTVVLVASSTLPFGSLISSFADDADGISFNQPEIGEMALGINGDPITWSKPAIIEATISVIPTSPANEVLSILLQANMVGQDKTSSRDAISITIVYPNGQLTALNNGIITSGQPAYNLGQDGRMSTMEYKFSFAGYSSI